MSKTKSFYYSSGNEDEVNSRVDAWLGRQDGKIEVLGNTDGPYGTSKMMKELKVFYKEKETCLV